MAQNYVVIAYLRKSDEDKHGQVQSIAKQRDWTLERAQQEGDNIEHYFEDTRTAKEPGRQGFAQMMAFIDQSSKPIKLYAWKTSRLARNGIDEGAIKFAITRKKIAHIITRDRSYDEYTNHILLGVDFGEATQFSLDLSKDVKEGMLQKVEVGYRPTSTPNGWLNDPAGKQGDRKVFTDPERFPILQKEICKILDSKGAYRAADSLRYLNDIGFQTKRGTSMSSTVLHGLLRNPFICGQYLWHGEWRVGSHQPMISPTEFETLQIYITGGRSRERKHTNVYNGLIRCSECGCWVTTEPPKIKKQKNGKINVYNYMRCTKNKGTCSQKCIRMEKAEKQIVSVLSTIETDDDFFSICLNNVQRKAIENTHEVSRQRAIIQKSYNENEVKITSLTEKYSLGKIDDDVYSQMIDQYKKRRFDLERKIQSSGEQRNHVLDDFVKDSYFAKTISKRFRKSNILEQKEILQKLQSNLWLVNGNLLVDLKSSFVILSQYHRLRTVIEPLKNRSYKGKSGCSELQISSWYTFSELIRTYVKMRIWMRSNEII